MDDNNNFSIFVTSYGNSLFRLYTDTFRNAFTLCLECSKIVSKSIYICT